MTVSHIMTRVFVPTRRPRAREDDDDDDDGVSTVPRDASHSSPRARSTREETTMKMKMRWALTENLRLVDAFDDEDARAVDECDECAADDRVADDDRARGGGVSTVVASTSAYFKRGKENAPTPRKSTPTPTKTNSPILSPTTRERGEGRREERARARRATRLALTVIEQWRWFAKSARATSRARTSATTRAWRAWRRNADARRHRALRATIYARLGRRQRAFTAWRERAREARREAMEEARRESERAAERAAWYREYSRATRAAFATWRAMCAPEVRAERARLVFYDRYARKTMMKRALDAWREGARAQMAARADALVAESFYEAKTCGRAFRAWRSARRCRRRRAWEADADVEDRVERFQSYRAVSIVSRAFAAWADAARASRTRAVERTPVKVRAGRTQRALYAWLFDRSKASEYEEEVLDFLDEREALRDDDDDDDELDELEAAVDEYEALREETKALVEEVQRANAIVDARKRSARRRVLRSTAEHLRRRRDELLPLVRRAAGEANWRSRSAGTSSFGFSAFDREEEDSDEDDPLLYRKFV